MSAHAKTAGYLYAAALRTELTRTLGVEWTRARNEIAEIEGVPAEVLRAFSRGRVEIEAAMEPATCSAGTLREPGFS